MLKRLAANLLARPLHIFRKRKAHTLAARANRLLQAGAIDEAIRYYRASIQALPQLSGAHNNLGIALQLVGQAEAALQSFELAIAADPAHGEAHYNLALLALDLQQPALAETHLALAASLLDKPAAIAAGYGRLAAFAGNMEGAAQQFRDACLTELELHEAADSYLLALAACESVSPEMLAHEHMRIGQTYCQPSSPRERSEYDCTPGRQLKIAYLSPDFREHSVRYFFEPVISHHDRSCFHVICYNDTARRDAYTESVRLRSDSWRDIAGLPNSQVEEIVLADKPDILVELAGHSSGNRLPLLATRLAPVQISGLGYPPTTGISNIDYKLSDAIADPPDADIFYSEKLMRLPGTFWCYAPPGNCPAPAPSPCEASGYVTFGCFGNAGKITLNCLQAWREILHATPKSKLLIKSTSLGNPWGEEKLKQRLLAAGIDLHRVVLQGASSGLAFQQAYGQVDLILDTFPFNGGTTTAHALWMSVPVLTHAGRLLISRMGATMLNACNCHGLIADSWEEYIAKGIALANSPQQLTTLRTSLRSAMASSSLCDGAGYVAGLEAAYRTAWQAWCNQNQP